VSEPVLLHEDTINKLAEVLAEKIRAPEKWIEFLLWYILSKKTLLFKDFVLTCTKTAPRKIQLRQISAS
jgi:hypothetical protein